MRKIRTAWFGYRKKVVYDRLRVLEEEHAARKQALIGEYEQLAQQIEQLENELSRLRKGGADS